MMFGWGTISFPTVFIENRNCISLFEFSQVSIIRFVQVLTNLRYSHTYSLGHAVKLNLSQRPCSNKHTHRDSPQVVVRAYFALPL
jgi:hypothetical protein